MDIIYFIFLYEKNKRMFTKSVYFQSAVTDNDSHCIMSQRRIMDLPEADSCLIKCNAFTGSHDDMSCLFFRTLLDLT